MEDPNQTPPTIYTRTFWLCYLANVLLVTANSLTFRFAEFVAFLGGEERIAGTIVSVGMFAAVLSRFGVGQAVDRYGTRMLWRSSSAILGVSYLLFLTVDGISWPIYLVRILFTVSLACMFSCAMIYIQKQVPARRRMEVIATLGTSGFVGMTIGPQLGDVLFRILSPGWPQFVALFCTAGMLGAVYFGIVFFVTRNDQHSSPKQTMPAHRLLFRYWPGQILISAIVLGGASTVPTVFLTRYATHSGLRGIGTFFLAYSGSAFLFRLLSARYIKTIGLRSVILIGMAGLGSGQLALLLVSAEWHFLLPAALCGLGHALLFPAVVAGGANTFPNEYRGSGTMLILGFTEIGFVIAAPILGITIDLFGFPTMFAMSGSTILTLGLVYYLTAAEPRDLSLEDELPETVREPIMKKPRVPTLQPLGVSQETGVTVKQPA